MIKIIQISSIAALGLAVGIFAAPFIFETGGFKNSDKLLKMPSILDEFQKLNRDNNSQVDEDSSPLVKQAREFSLYLDPPAPAPTSPSPGSRRPRTVDVAPQRTRTTSSFFRVLGTSFKDNDPNRCYALIDKPGEGMKWVKPGDSIGHYTVEGVESGVLRLDDGSQVAEMEVEKQPKVNLVRNYYPPGAEVPEKEPVNPFSGDGSTGVSRGQQPSQRENSSSRSRGDFRPVAANKVDMAEMMEALKKMQANSKDNQLGEAMSVMKAMSEKSKSATEKGNEAPESQPSRRPVRRSVR